MPVQYILLDIEGTVSPIPFVHKVLFPYARQRLADFVELHGEGQVVKACVDDTIATVEREDKRTLTRLEAVARLVQWIDEDRKHPALKTLQGLIWREGYESGAFTSQLYPEVAPVLAAWKARGLYLGIYSSGSVQAQKLLFKYTVHGDMTPLFSDFFDTEVGPKREASAYQEILNRLQRPATSVLFLSDVAAELEAANDAGIPGIQLVRPGTTPDLLQLGAKDLKEVDALLAKAALR